MSCTLYDVLRNAKSSIAQELCDIVDSEDLDDTYTTSTAKEIDRALYMKTKFIDFMNRSQNISLTESQAEWVRKLIDEVKISRFDARVKSSFHEEEIALAGGIRMAIETFNQDFQLGGVTFTAKLYEEWFDSDTSREWNRHLYGESFFEKNISIDGTIIEEKSDVSTVLKALSEKFDVWKQGWELFDGSDNPNTLSQVIPENFVTIEFPRV